MNKNLFFIFLITLPVVFLVTVTLDSKVTLTKTNAASVMSEKTLVAENSPAIKNVADSEEDKWGSLGIEKIGPADPPKFTIENINGNLESLDKYKGKVIFLNFWATWCPPCVLEMPMMDRLYKKLKDKGFVVVAVDDYEPRERVEKFLKDKDYSFPILIDPSGKVTEAFRSMVLPSSFIINKEGKVIGKAIGMREWDSPEFEAFFEELLK